MKTVYLVRHGESELNARETDVFVPDREAKLTKRGVQQSHFIAERAMQLKIDALVASPYVRTRDTAVMISERVGLPVEYSELFTERRVPSSLIGLVLDAPETKALFRSWSDGFFATDSRVGDGENFEDLKVRASEALEYLAERPESNILVVSHGFFSRMVMALIMFGPSLTPHEFHGVVGGTRTDNTGITVLAHDLTPHHDIDPDTARWRIRVFNDHAHLG